ncbi:hypothetical protein K443DRAFT_685689 [Laccaria amethystina LaAM-08-1]|uniref:Unplaced genomic scaffold K443scaffold_424, whole genome shotgun sequence n=1 Tax=Laccaria amethystina LaAM-08-1 TaxID=1095629 RepID=A0A0C9WHV7_9AGAR|nr:hypothetical protein K443DRAFT_685689 [Laccaria amethystina LaAM-08-1]
MAPISAHTARNRCLWTQSSQRRFSVVRIHPQLVLAMGCRNVIHRDLLIADSALVGLD